MSVKLQPEIEPAARWLSRKLAMAFDEDLRLWLGGGSLLAARYHHRLSTDLDLWWSLAPGTPLGGIGRYVEQVTGSPLLVEDKLADDHWEGGRPTANLMGWIRGKLIDWHDLPPEIEGIDVTINQKDFPPIGSKHGERVEGTIFVAQTDAQVLYGKLNRIADDRQVAIRDVYDLSVASHLDPRELMIAFVEQGAQRRRQAAMTLRSRDVDVSEPLLEAEEYGWRTWSEDEAEEAKRTLAEALERNDPERLGRAVWRR